ncbi:MAG: hypothetical protein OCD02_16185 [Spirochaetaceae bacterium]
MKNKFSLLIFLIVSVSLFSETQSVITTTSWTAAFAKLAGAENITMLAPMDMKHPPEHEVTIKELQMIKDADYMVFAGYEAMVPRVKQSLGKSSNVKLIQIKTFNDFKTIEESVLKIADEIGTMDIALKNLKAVKAFFDSWKNELKGKDLTNIPVHFHQQKLLRSLGIKPSMVYGPAPPSLGEIKKSLELKPLIIIDNIHNKKAGVFMEQKPTPTIISWINFPGIKGTESLLDVLTYNKNELTKVLK